MKTLSEVKLKKTTPDTLPEGMNLKSERERLTRARRLIRKGQREYGLAYNNVSFMELWKEEGGKYASAQEFFRTEEPDPGAE